jgi:hypothetical protein
VSITKVAVLFTRNLAKLSLQFFRILHNFLEIFCCTGIIGKETKIIFVAIESLVYKWVPELHIHTLAAAGRFADGEVGPDQGNK